MKLTYEQLLKLYTEKELDCRVFEVVEPTVIEVRLPEIYNERNGLVRGTPGINLEFD